MFSYQSGQKSKKTPNLIQQQQPQQQRQKTHPQAILQRTQMNPSSLTPADVLQLQRTIGNRAVGNLIEAGQSSSGGIVQRQEDVTKKFNKKSDKEEAFASDADLWHRTMFDKGNLKGEDAKVLEQQQQLLKRHFLAMGTMGVQTGNQNTGKYSPNEKIPLAAYPSHGGRFAYEAADSEVGNKFHNMLLTGNTETSPKVAPNQKVGGGTEGDAGLYQRISTHGQKYESDNKRWVETDQKPIPGISPKDAYGMNIPMGGVGNELKDKKERTTTIGAEGWAKARRRKSQILGRTNEKQYQLGSGLFKYDKHQQGGSRLMVGFEGTAPNADNQLGAQHGVMSTVGGRVLGMERFKNDQSLTGQKKGGKIDGMPHGHGSMKSDVTEEGLDKLQNAYRQAEYFKKNDRKYEEEFYKNLLTSTNQKERDALFRELDKKYREHTLAKMGNPPELSQRNAQQKMIQQIEYDHEKAKERVPLNPRAKRIRDANQKFDAFYGK